MTGPKGNTEFCFPETLNVSEAKPREIQSCIEAEGKQNSLFPAEPVIINKCFVITSQLKTGKSVKKLFALCQLLAHKLPHSFKVQGA